MAHHQHKNKISSLKFVKLDREPRTIVPLIHFFLLLLLMLSAAASVLKLSLSSPASSYSSAVHPADLFFAETINDSESLKTHISSNKNQLGASQKSQEDVSSKALSCPALIHGRMNNSNMKIEKGILCCDRSHHRTDVCYMRGDIRTESESSSILLYNPQEPKSTVEKIRPYTRKWEKSIMNTIDEINLRPIPVVVHNKNKSRCNVIHGVPAIMLSTGGYTGNVYHEFNDGLIPLYITAERFKGEVVVVVVEYHSWWMTKYRSVVAKLTNYKLVDFSKDRRVHCFPEMIVGLYIHGELTIEPQLMTTSEIDPYQVTKMD